MKTFAYKALDNSGSMIEGELDVLEEKDLEQFFLKSDLRPLRVEQRVSADESTGSLKEFFEGFLQKKLLDNELIAFTRQFAAAYGAGLAVASTMRMLAKQATHQGFKKTLDEIASRIEAGKGLTDSFQKYPRFFPSTYLAILKSGEVSGKLDTVLNYSANLMETKLIHRERVKSTLLYPKMVVGLISLTIAIIVTFVIPQFAKFYDKFDAKLPLPTLILIEISDFVQKFWPLFILSIPFIAYAAFKLRRNPAFMLWFHQMWLKVPILGICFMKIELTNFCATFSILLKAGVRITESTRIAIASMQNTYLKQEFGKIISTLEQGGTLGQALNQITVVPQLMTSMIVIGEESGELDRLLQQVAALYENETEMLLKKLPTLIEPVVLGFLFVVVLFLAIAVYLPIWRMASLLKR